MRHPVTTTTAALALAAAALAPAAGAHPAPLDRPVSSQSPQQVVSPQRQTDTGGLDAGWAIALCGGAALTGAAAGFAGGRVRRASALS